MTILEKLRKARQLLKDDPAMTLGGAIDEVFGDDQYEVNVIIGTVSIDNIGLLDRCIEVVERREGEVSQKETWVLIDPEGNICDGSNATLRDNGLDDGLICDRGEMLESLPGIQALRSRQR